MDLCFSGISLTTAERHQDLASPLGPSARVTGLGTVRRMIAEVCALLTYLPVNGVTIMVSIPATRSTLHLNMVQAGNSNKYYMTNEILTKQVEIYNAHP